jgi:type II secretory pathway pseudopilin PulG
MVSAMRARQSGFTYLALLLFVAIMGVGTAAAGVVWHTAARRDKEQELLFVGDQIRQAIGRYYRESPGLKRFPARLEDLVRDPRFPGAKRHLRKLYADPITGSTEWGLVRAPDGGVMGVYSLSEETPVKMHFDDNLHREFTGRTKYREWRFNYVPRPVPNAPRAPSPPPSG